MRPHRSFPWERKICQPSRRRWEAVPLEIYKRHALASQGSTRPTQARHEGQTQQSAVESSHMKCLVIVARGFHLGYAGCYGNEWVQTPNLDALAAEGIVFDEHFCDLCEFDGANRTWRNGRVSFPWRGGDVAHCPENGADLIRLLNQHGVATSLVRDARREISTDFSLDWNKSITVNFEKSRRTRDDIEPARSLANIANAASDSLTRLKTTDNWLLWVELATLMHPWHFLRHYEELYTQSSSGTGGEVEEPIAISLDDRPRLLDSTDNAIIAGLQNRYAGGVSSFDSILYSLFEGLRERALIDDLLIVLTSDRGMPLGEHGVLGYHRPWLHDELVHIPLILRLPGRAEAGRRVSAVTQSADLMPTLLDAFGVPCPDVDGKSLLPLARKEVEKVREVAYIGGRANDCVEWAVRTPEWCYLLPIQSASGDPPRGPQLYAKPDDRWEVNNVLQHYEELAEQLEKDLRAIAGTALAAETPRQVDTDSPQG